MTDIAEPAVDIKWNPDDEDYIHAWKKGYLHSFYGLEAGYTSEMPDIYEEGKRDGSKDRDEAIARGEVDPHRW